MGPNWQPEQGTNGNRTGAWAPGEDDVVQRPLGSSGAPSQPHAGYQVQGTAPWPSPGGQAWQQPMAAAPSAAPQPSNPWATGPADPFDEPGEAPELRHSRSDHLYDMEDRFWDTVPGKPSGKNTKKQQPLKAESHTMRWMILIVAVLAVVAALVYGTVFQVNTIRVEGQVHLTEQEIIDLSGIKLGMNTFSIDDDQVERNIERNRYLSFVCVDKQLPDQVTLQVKERVPAAAIKHFGLLYVMDNRGMVLEEYMDTDYDTGLVLVDGLSVHDCRVGQTIDLTDDVQMQTFTEILVELKVMRAMDMVKELDLSNMDNLFIVSKDGFTVLLGPAQDIHAKLRSMLLTLDHLRGEGYIGGTVDVSKPVNPTYTPE